MRHYKIQLIDSVSGKAIDTSGGKCYVAGNGEEAKVALLDSTGAAAANPSSLTNGVIEFYTADSVPKVDLYIQAPSGHFVVAKNIDPSGPNSINVDKSRSETVMVIPFSIADTSANTETDTGFDFPTNSLALPIGLSVDVIDIDATETVDLGTDSGASGDANGLIAAASVGTAGVVKATLVNGGVTLGALLVVQDSANAGDGVPEASAAVSGKSITYTLTAGSDTGTGFFKIPVLLPVSSL